MDPAQLLREAEEAAGEALQEELLDHRSLRRLVTILDKRCQANTELRMKYADQPEKAGPGCGPRGRESRIPVRPFFPSAPQFLESEVDLDETIKKLGSIAASPELYPDLVSFGAVPLLVSLLSHENTDLVGDTLELLEELTDADVVEDSAEEAKALVTALLDSTYLEQVRSSPQTARPLERLPDDALPAHVTGDGPVDRPGRGQGGGRGLCLEDPQHLREHGRDRPEGEEATWHCRGPSSFVGAHLLSLPNRLELTHPPVHVDRQPRLYSSGPGCFGGSSAASSPRHSMPTRQEKSKGLAACLARDGGSATRLLLCAPR